MNEIKAAWKFFYRDWMAFAHALGKINSIIILSLLFIFVIGPYAIIRMVFVRKQRHAQASFWLEKKYNEPTQEILERQF